VVVLLTTKRGSHVSIVRPGILWFFVAFPKTTQRIENNLGGILLNEF
jgi:hypothetical protein